MEGDAGLGSAIADEWGSTMASGDATKLAELVLVWCGSKPESALSILNDCVSVLEQEAAVLGLASSPVPSPPTTPGEWGSAVASGDAIKLAELVLVWSDSKPERALCVLRNCVSLMEEEVAFSAPASSPLRSPPTTPGPSPTSCLKAIIIALNETCDGKSWYTSTMELQLASLEFCMASRNCQTLHLKVDPQIPRRLLAAADAPPPHPKRLCGTRVPRLKARRVTWTMPTAAGLSNPIFALSDVDYMGFGEDFDRSLDAVAWPQQLQTIEFCEPSRFNQPLEGVQWPAYLQTIILGESWNHPIEDVTWPPSLRQLTFGLAFDQPVERTVFPALLEELAFGADFDQPIEDVSWPASLQKLVFGIGFNNPVDNVRWPASLQELTFGLCEENSLDDGIMLFSDFNQGIGSAVWPASLRRLTLGDTFRQSLQGLGTWMPNLETFRFLDTSLGGDSLLRGIEWPTGLRQLAVFEESSLDGVEVPSTVEVLQLYRDYDTADLGF